MSSPFAHCKTLERLRQHKGPGDAEGGVQVAGGWGHGQGGAETLPSCWAQADGKAAGERRGIPFGSVFVHECFSSWPSWLQTFYSLIQT